MKLTSLIMVLVLLLIPAMLAVPIMTKDTVTATVTKTARIVEKSGDSVDSKYLIYTDVETFEDVDSWIYFKFNSSDVYGALKEGTTYKFTVYGWRVPFMSWYRNIVRFEKI